MLNFVFAVAKRRRSDRDKSEKQCNFYRIGQESSTARRALKAVFET